MTKSKDSRIKEAQGQKSAQIRSQNEFRIYTAIVKKPSSFSELLLGTKLSKPVLMKHLKTLGKDGFIFKDTIKPDEASEPNRIGRVVYKATDEKIDLFFERFVEKFFPLFIFDDEVSKKTDEEYEAVQKHYRAIAQIVSDYLKKKRYNKAQIKLGTEIVSDAAKKHKL